MAAIVRVHGGDWRVTCSSMSLCTCSGGNCPPSGLISVVYISSAFAARSKDGVIAARLHRVGQRCPGPRLGALPRTRSNIDGPGTDNKIQNVKSRRPFHFEPPVLERRHKYILAGVQKCVGMSPRGGIERRVSSRCALIDHVEIAFHSPSSYTKPHHVPGLKYMARKHGDRCVVLYPPQEVPQGVQELGAEQHIAV